MELSRYSDFSLRVLMLAASLPADDHAQIETVAQGLGLSRHHVRKIVHELGLAGFLTTTPGRNGGFRLARPAADVRLSDVLKKTERSFALVECLRDDGGDCSLQGPCRLQGVLRKANNAFMQVLAQHTLADLLTSGIKGRLKAAR